MWIVFWIGFSLAAGVIASNKGRSFLGFTLLSILLSPILGLIAAVIVEPNSAEQENKAVASGVYCRCPYCAELIKAGAKVCKHCGKDIEPLTKQICPHCGFKDIPIGEKYCYNCERKIA